MTGRIRKVWGTPFALLSAATFAMGGLLHHQALEAAALETARQELGSCCHPVEKAPTQQTTESRTKETQSKIALAAGVLLLGAAVAPAAFAGDASGRTSS